MQSLKTEILILAVASFVLAGCSKKERLVLINSYNRPIDELLIVFPGGKIVHKTVEEGSVAEWNFSPKGEGGISLRIIVEGKPMETSGGYLEPSAPSLNLVELDIKKQLTFKGQYRY